MVWPLESLLPAMLCSLGELQFDKTPLVLCASSLSYQLRLYLSAVLEQAVSAQNYCTAINKLLQIFYNKGHQSIRKHTDQEDS